MSPLKKLTKRENEVLSLLPHGYTNREIANHLGIAEHTVESHLDRIYRKLDVTGRTLAACMYLFSKK